MFRNLSLLFLIKGEKYLLDQNPFPFSHAHQSSLPSINTHFPRQQPYQCPIASTLPQKEGRFFTRSFSLRVYVLVYVRLVYAAETTKLKM